MLMVLRKLAGNGREGLEQGEPGVSQCGRMDQGQKKDERGGSRRRDEWERQYLRQQELIHLYGNISWPQ